MKLRSILSLAAALAAVPLSALGQADVPTLINYQGFVTDTNTVPLGNGIATNYDVLFQIYDVPSGGAALWGEMQTVTILNGQFSALLGNGLPISAGNIPHNNTLNLAELLGPAPITSGSIFIGITVNNIGQAEEPELVPRQQLVANPFALHALNADNATTATFAETIADGAVTAASLAESSVSATQIAGNAVTTVKIANDAITTDKITSDAITTVKIASNAITAAKIADNSITSAKIVNGTITHEDVNFATQAGQTFRYLNPNDQFDSAGLELPKGEIRTGQLTGLRLNFPSQFGAHDPTMGIYQTSTGPENYSLILQNDRSVGGGAVLADNGTWSQFSDARLKKDVAPARGLLEKALALEPVRYRLKTESSEKPLTIGFIAQNVGEEFPELVTQGSSWTLNYAGLSTVAIGAVREQHTIVSAQGEKIETLRAENAELKARLGRLERALLAK